MTAKADLRDYPQVLINVVRSYEADGSILCLASSLKVAQLWRTEFDLPLPLGGREASCFVQELNGINVYLQPHLEQGTNYAVRGLWVGFGGMWFVLVEADRPEASRIRILIHELSEKLRHISHLLHTEVPECSPKELEAWATEVSVYVKMPPEKFCNQVSHVSLDIEALKAENDETLGCVARHLKNWIMFDKTFSYCRFDIAPYGLAKDVRLRAVAERLGGTCIRVVDVTKSRLVDTRRRKNSFPSYNLPAFYHYRILNSVMNKYIAANQPVFFQDIVGGASDTRYYRDLFGEFDLCALLVPYGSPKRPARGFFMIAVHPRDRHLLDHILDRHQPEERGGVDWLFSNYSYQHKKERTPLIQQEIRGLGDAPPELGGLFIDQFGQESYLWPTPQTPLEFIKGSSIAQAKQDTPTIDWHVMNEAIRAGGKFPARVELASII